MYNWTLYTYILFSHMYRVYSITIYDNDTIRIYTTTTLINNTKYEASLVVI